MDRRLPPEVICRWVGHRRESYVGGYYFDRRGRQREKWYQRCKRCGTSDGSEVYREGILERFTIWRLRRIRYQLLGHFKMWWRQECEECHKSKVRFGHKLGGHDNCHEIPF